MKSKIVQCNGTRAIWMTAPLDDEDRPRPRGDLASRLASESLDSYSQDELEQRIHLLEQEIVRVRDHRDRAAAHRKAADALFRPPA